MSNEILLVANSSSSFPGATAKAAFCNSSIAAHACLATFAISDGLNFFFHSSPCAPHDAEEGLRDSDVYMIIRMCYA